MNVTRCDGCGLQFTKPVPPWTTHGCADGQTRPMAPGYNLFRNVIITGEPEIGKGVSIGDFSEVNAKGARVVIGDGCDVASFVSINAADSSERCLGRAKDIVRRDITIGERVFIGSHCFIGGGVAIGARCKVAAGTIITGPIEIPPASLVVQNSHPHSSTGRLPGYWYPLGRVLVKVGCYA